MKKLVMRVLVIFFLLALLVPFFNPTKQAFANSTPPCDSAHLGNYWEMSIPAGTDELICDFADYINSSGTLVGNWYWMSDGVIAPDPTFWTDYNSSLEMDITGGSTSNGAQIDQYYYTGSASQQWTPTSTGYIYAREEVNLNSSKCIGVQGGSTVQGAKVVQWDCDFSSNQEWVYMWLGLWTLNGWPIWRIVNYNSKLCLGISGSSKSAGVGAVQWDCNGNFDQFWY